MLTITLLKALTVYKIELQTKCSEGIDLKLKKIDICQEYINKGNEINGTWLANNNDVLSRAIIYSHNLKHIEGNNIDEEHRDLNDCMTFYENFYKNIGIDFPLCEQDLW